MRRKVVILVNGGVGGAERMSVNIGKMLPLDRYEVKFVVFGVDFNICEFIPTEYQCEKIYISQNFFKIFRNYTLIPFITFYKVLKRNEPSIVFCSCSANNAAAIFAAKMLGVPIIVRNTGTVSTYNRYLKFLLRIAYPLANAIIAQQSEMADEIINLLSVTPSKVFNLPNPLDVSVINEKITVESPLPKNQINFVQVGRFAEAKAQDITIRAFKLVVNKLKNVHLYFVGRYTLDNDIYKDVKQYAIDNGLIDKVHFIGYDSNPYRWIKECNAFVFPSRKEGLPNALIEASYLGAPCVATKCIGIISDIIKDGYNGYTIDIDDITGLSEGMMKAINLSGFTMLYKSASSRDFIDLFDNN